MESLTPDQVIDILPDSEYRNLLHSSSPGEIQAFTFIEKRLNDIEIMVFRKKSITKLTRAQIMLMANDLGMFTSINALRTNQVEKAMLLSLIFGFSASNIKSDLSKINNGHSSLVTETNLKALLVIYKKAGLSDLVTKTEMKIEELIRIKQEKNRFNK